MSRWPMNEPDPWDQEETWEDDEPDWEALACERPARSFESARRCAFNNAESPRRQKLFNRSRDAMSVMVALRGRYAPPITVTAWFGRHGRRLGLFSYYDDDHEIQWTPRGGFKIVEIEDIPF